MRHPAGGTLGRQRTGVAYQAFVLGSAVYLGTWLKQARRFVEVHADELAKYPTRLFASGSITGDPPVADDRNAIRLALVTRLVGATHAHEHKFFAGKLDTSKLGPLERASVRMSRGREGDHRDWRAIDEWARGIARELDAHGAAGHTSTEPTRSSLGLDETS